MAQRSGLAARSLTACVHQSLKKHVEEREDTRENCPHVCHHSSPPHTYMCVPLQLSHTHTQEVNVIFQV